jgi:hypothetical protein
MTKNDGIKEKVINEARLSMWEKWKDRPLTYEYFTELCDKIYEETIKHFEQKEQESRKEGKEGMLHPIRASPESSLENENQQLKKEIERLHLIDIECSECGGKKISFNGNLFCYHCCWTTNVALKSQLQEQRKKIEELIKKAKKRAEPHTPIILIGELKSLLENENE